MDEEGLSRGTRTVKERADELELLESGVELEGREYRERGDSMMINEEKIKINRKCSCVEGEKKSKKVARRRRRRRRNYS